MDNYESPELRSDELERFASLPREREPERDLEERVVTSLRADGAFVSRPWYRKSVPIPLAAAAGFVLFALGTLAGVRWSGAAAGSVSAPAPAPVRVMQAPPDGKLVTWM
jgi:hypothetical protein